MITNSVNLIFILGTAIFFYKNEIRYYFYVLFDFFSQVINNTNDLEETNGLQNATENKPDQTIIEKYEDKYLPDIRKMNKEFVFTDTENELKLIKYISFLSTIKEEYYDKIVEIKDNILEIELRMIKTQKQTQSVEDDDEYYYEEDDTEEYYTEYLTDQLNAYKLNLKKYYELLQTSSGEEVLKQRAQEQANNYIINDRWDKLKNNFIIEKTPVGNVLMVYNNDKETFQYYSDNTIPYRYLETVARKYVKQFNCRPIFVDMEEELKVAEEKWLKENEEKTNIIKEKENQNKEHQNKDQSKENKKNVFAKFKSYNKEAGTGHVNTMVPPKNNIPNNKLTKEQENEKILLKEKANRYTYEGKFANFNFLKKIERKIVDKKYGMSFADFKKLKTV